MKNFKPTILTLLALTAVLWLIGAIGDCALAKADALGDQGRANTVARIERLERRIERTKLRQVTIEQREAMRAVRREHRAHRRAAKKDLR